MPRRKRQCFECHHSFISSTLAGVSECENCVNGKRKAGVKASDSCLSVSESQLETSSDTAMIDMVDMSSLNAVHLEEASAVVSNVCNDPHDDDQDDPSEADDDFHCTQIIHIDDSDEEEEETDNNQQPRCLEDDLPLVQLLQPSSSSASQAPAMLDQQTGTCSDSDVKDDFKGDISDDAEEDPLVTFSTHKNNDLMTCTVCGASLAHITAGWKGRLNHIKRCAKTHHYTAKEASFNDDYELFEQNEKPASTTIGSPSTLNPYNRPSSWHGSDAKLAQAQATSCTSRLPTAFQTLMAGARRAAKIEKIKASSPPAKTAKQKGWGSRPAVDYSQRQCPGYKKIFNTDFVVDGFYYAKTSLTQNYFLTHFHSDHYGGITKAWNAGTIYCSMGTANLVHQQLGVDRKYLHPLPMDAATVVESRGKPIRVTLIDANHCPGAVMFLFQVASRSILHVGDFRWNRDAMQKQVPLRPFMTGKEKIDDLYLDTTYCDAKYDLPTQQEAIDAAIHVARQEVDSASRSKTKLLMLFGAYTIGKERIYLSVARALNMKVYVDSRRMRILKSLDWKNDELSQLTTKSNETCIWVVPLGHINIKKLEDYLTTRTGSFDRVVGFRPTGWSHTKKKASIITSNTRGRVAVHNVPYSEHSSFPELVDCLACLRPKRIIPTVSVSKSQQQVDLLLSRWKP